jgi:hypothetical protein
MGGAGEPPPTTTAASATLPSWMLTLVDCLEKYGILMVIFAIIAVGLYTLIQSPGYLQRNLEKYFFVMCLPIIFLFFVILSIENAESLPSVAVKVGSALLFVGVMAWLYTETNSSYMFSLYMSWTVFVCIGLVGLAFIYGYVVGEMRRWKGWSGFFAQVLFFLPCILNDAAAALLREFQLTSWSVYLFLLVELALIALYVSLPTITKSVMGTDDSQALILANNPIRLRENYQTLATSPKLYDPVNGTYRKNYAISMWIFVNPSTQQMAGYQKETQIFSYGNKSQIAKIDHVKPMICYYGGGTSTDNLADRNKFVFYFSRYPPANLEERNKWSYDAEMPLQRWNYVVINYSVNAATLFINGEHKHTCELRDALPEYSQLDTITAGDPTGPGLHGGLCNVVFYKHILTPEQIAFSYNLMKDKDPPLMTVATAPAAVEVPTKK